MEFDIATATAILKPCKLKKYFVINEHGVWPRVAPDDTENEVAEPSEVDMADLIFEQWRPAQELANDPHMQGLLPRKSVAQTPALPSNFNARELAAFMLYGYGTWVQSHYGNCRDWEAGPDPEMLKKIPPHQDIARSAVKEAFDAYRDAVKVVGPRPLGLEAEHARKAYRLANSEANEREGVSAAIPGTEESAVRRARAVASIAALDDAMEATATTYTADEAAWLKAMVRQLLLPAPGLVPAMPEAVDTLVKPYQVGEVAAGLLTKEITATFAGLHDWNATRWSKNLSSTKWLHPARIALGAAGGASAVWNPLILAQLMHSKKMDSKTKEKLMNALKSRFNRNPVLMPWRDAFNEYFATYCATD